MFGSRSTKSKGLSLFHGAATNAATTSSAAAADATPVKIEALEQRSYFSMTVQPDIIHALVASSATQVTGYTPAEIEKAYGFDKITLSNGTTGDGAGQTIAIIDAYNDPNLAGDLSVFDSKFGISDPPSLKIVNQTGGGTLPSTDAGWAGEISLDVEWAHAIAPKANILLVEAKSSSISDLMAAVDYARHASGVSVVSMSWGGSEFFSWFGGESSSQTNYDPIFTTPSGHQGVTFIASAGDSGVESGVQWPASSPNVLSVGGTTLVLDSSGNYVSEQSWSGTNGGYSQVETEPTYQNGVQSSGARSVPDVSYDADPNTGFAVYDSLPYQGYSGWQEVGGTSAGAPQWAALIAIANEARSLAGKSSLDGATQTLPMLYALYSAPDTSGYANYTTDFFDIIDTTGNDPWQFGWGGLGWGNSSATAGYDTMTGLGSPHANMIVDALAAGGSSTGGTGGSGPTGPGGSGGTTPTTLANSPISGAFSNEPLFSVVEGDNGVLHLLLTNTGATKFDGPLSITLYASDSQTATSSDTVLGTLTLNHVVMRAGSSKMVRLKYTYSSSLAAGNYFLVASIAATGTNTNPMQAATTSVAIAKPTVDLSTAFASSAPISVTPGKGGSATVTISNLGNVAAVGTITLTLDASTDGLLDAGAQLISNALTRTIKLAAGHSLTFHVHFTAPVALAAGSYDIIAGTTSSLKTADTNASNDTAIIATA